MASTISPIDESSFSDTSAFDPEAILNNPPRSSVSPTTNTAEEPEPDSVSQERPEPEESYVDQHEEAPAEKEEPQAVPRVSRISPFARFADILLDSRTVRFFGLVMVIVAIYAMIVSISFFAHIGSDQSAVLSGELDPEMIENTGGPFGAWLSNTLINNWLGLGAFLVIIWMVLTGLSLMKFYKADFWGLTMRCLLSAVATSIICGFVTSSFAAPFYWGGLHGHILNERLVTFTGIWGALGVSLIMAGMVAFLYLSELSRFFRLVGRHLSSYMERNRIRREERARLREEQRIRREAEKREREEQEAARRAALAATEVVTNTDVTADAYEEPSAPATTVNTLQETPASVPASAHEELVSESLMPEAEVSVDDSASVVEEEVCEEQPSLFNISPSPYETEKHEIEAEEADLNTPLFSTPASTPTVQNRMASSVTSQVTSQPKFDPRAELSGYRFPSIDLLRPSSKQGPSVDADEMEDNKARITNTLNNYGIPIRRIEATVGPTVTLYEIIPAEGVRIAKIKHLEDDIALSLSALGIRIIAPIPGRGTIGIEVPNKDPQTVSMRSVIESDKYQTSSMDLPMAMGCTISNEVFMADLCKMPHLLVAGATGMGKSVGLNAIIASLLYKKHPSELKFVLIDPKMVEFSLYAKLERHYLAKLPDEEEAIITDPSKVVATLNSLCIEMDNRYALLKDAAMRNIKEYNERFSNHLLNPEKGHRFLPYIVVIVDEFADLIMTAGKEVETPIARIAQKARAVGIHMILATQRPSTNVITGIIKANFPGRIAFRVFQMVDSRTILDRPGANQLIGRGDMLFSNNGKIERVQCAFIDTPEVSAICEAIDEQVGYDHAYELPEYVPDGDAGTGLASIGDRDPLFDECARLVVTTDTASTSSLQRRYSIGYNRAGKIMDQMEAAGIVGPSQGGKPRQVLVDPMTLERILENK